MVYASSFKPVSYTKFGHGQPNKKTADYEDCVGLSGRYGKAKIKIASVVEKLTKYFAIFCRIQNG